VDDTEPYTISLFIVPDKGQYAGHYRIFGGMDAGATNPDYRIDGFVADLIMDDNTGNASGSLYTYIATAETKTDFIDIVTPDGEFATTGKLSAVIDGTDIKVYWGATLLVTKAFTPIGTRFGFGMECTEEGFLCLADRVRFEYILDASGSPEVNRTRMVASSGGRLYREANLGVMDQVTTGLTLASDLTIHAAERLQKLFIADYSNPRIKLDDGVGTTTALASAAAATNFTHLGIDLDSDVVVITAGTGVTTGVYEISVVTATTITLATSAGTAYSAVEFYIDRGAKIYDPVADTLVLWSANEGTVPPSCRLIALWRDRIVLSGAWTDPHNWFMARQGDPFDWDYAPASLDVGRAVAGNNTEAGRIGQPVTALMPFSDDLLLMSGESSLWVFRGDPAMEGRIDNLSHEIGVVSGRAWCRGPEGELIFLSRDGLYGLMPGANQFPQSISALRLPAELRDIDPAIYEVSLGFDVIARGVHIQLTPVNAREHVHWWVDWESKTFWPVDLQDDHEPLALHNYTSADQAETSVILACRDGYLRRYDNRNETDDGITIDSHIIYGPMQLGGTGLHSGMLSEMVATLAQGSGPVDWGIQTADSDEQAVSATQRPYDGTFTAGRNYTVRPRARGFSTALRLSNGASNRGWVVDNIVGVVSRSGRGRKL